MKIAKTLLTSFIMVFVANAMFAQTSISITANDVAGTGTTLSQALTNANVAASDVTSLIIISGPMKDADIAYMRTLTNLATLDMKEVMLVPDLELKDEDYVPKTPFITNAVDSVWTTELGPIGQNASVSYGITSANQLPSHIFDGMKKLTSVTIPSSVTTFGNYCFMGCEALTTVKNISQVTDLGRYTFLWCTSLQNFTIPNGVEELNNTFMGCTALTSVTFPTTDKITTIAGAFARCINFNLNKGALPSTITEIGDYAFFKCEKLTKVVLPETQGQLKKLGGFAFEYCYSLEEVDNFDKISLSAVDVKLSDDKTTESLTQFIPAYLFNGDKKLKTISFPSDINGVGGFAFNDCELIEGPITLHEGLTLVGYQGFGNCKKLVFQPQNNSHNLLPSTLKDIRDKAFVNCEAFTGAVTYPAQVNYIVSNGVFARSGITSVTIPEGITRIESDAFVGCKSLEGIVNIPSTVNYVGVGTFAENPRITGVEIASAGNLDLAFRAFYDDENLAYVEIKSANNVTMGNECFARNLKLGRVKLDEGEHHTTVTSIGSAGFAACIALPDAEANRLMQNLTVLNEAVFKDCTGLHNITIPASVEKIYNDAFGGAYDGTSVTLTEIHVSRDPAPTTITEGTYKDGEGQEHPKSVYPFGEYTDPNKVQVIFESSACNNIASYRNNTEFMRLMTKTLDESTTTVNWVNQEGANVVFKRTFGSTWNSLVLPFRYTHAQLVETFGEGSLVAEFVSYRQSGAATDNKVFRFHTIPDDVSENKPVLVRPKPASVSDENGSDENGTEENDSEENTYTFVNVNIVNPKVDTYGADGYTFNGTYVSAVQDAPNVPANSYFVKNNKFVYGGNWKNYSKAFRAWLEPTGGGSAPSMLATIALELEENGEVTAINAAEVFGPEAETAAKTYYSLDGRRVENPTNGIYIVNGKKVVIK